MIEWGKHSQYCRHADGFCAGFIVYTNRDDALDALTRTDTLMWREVGEWRDEQ